MSELTQGKRMTFSDHKRLDNMSVSRVDAMVMATHWYKGI